MAICPNTAWLAHTTPGDAESWQWGLLVEGLKFQMGGWWVMDFVITAKKSKRRPFQHDVE
jgi:hypothetical protein